MAFSTAAKNAMLDNLGATHASIHSGYSSSGANELSGGGYARQAISFSAASSGTKSGTCAAHTIPSSSTVAYVGKWTALTSGTFLGMWPVGGDPLEFHTDVSADLIFSSAHGLVDNDVVVFLGGTPPGGLSEATEYFVVNATTDTLQVSTTQGGGALDLTAVAAGSCYVSKLAKEVFSQAGAFQASSIVLSLGF